MKKYYILLFIIADGSVTYYDNKGGDTVDYLFVGGDLNNEIRVTDTSILPQFENNTFHKTSAFSNKIWEKGNFAISGNHGQVKRLYEWIGARNSNEWTYIKANTEFGKKSFIGTLNTGSEGINPTSGNKGFGNFSIIEHSHTHYGVSHDDFRASGLDYANRLNHPNAKFSVYAPLLTKAAYNNAFKNKMIPGSYPLKSVPLLKNEPVSKFIQY